MLRLVGGRSVVVRRAAAGGSPGAAGGSRETSARKLARLAAAGLQLDPGSGRMVPRTRVGRSAPAQRHPPGEGAKVCLAVGCSSLGIFSSRFTDLVGMPPSTYRHQATRATAGMPSCVAKQVTSPVRNREAPLREALA